MAVRMDREQITQENDPQNAANTLPIPMLATAKGKVLNRIADIQSLILALTLFS